MMVVVVMGRTKKKPIRGRYIIDEIDDVVYSTDSYEVYMMYLRIFKPNEYRSILHKEPSFRAVDPYYKPYNGKGSDATHETFIKALIKEKLVYERGYVPVRVIDEKGFYKTVWRNDPIKAELFLSKIKRDLI
jgi:hypothetical protein